MRAGAAARWRHRSERGSAHAQRAQLASIARSSAVSMANHLAYSQLRLCCERNNNDSKNNNSEKRKQRRQGRGRRSRRSQSDCSSQIGEDTCSAGADEKKPRRMKQRGPMESKATAARLLLLVSLCIQVAPELRSLAAVVRPTVFSDLNAPEVSANANSQQTQFTSHLNALNSDATPQTPSTKINPLKSRFCTALNGAKLDRPIGLESLAVDDFALSASSYSNEQVGPHLARLNLDIAGGAWCPVKPISSSNFGKEWIQVKLNRSFVISAIETQGRFGMGNGKEFVPSYQIEYSRNSGQNWHKWKDFRGSSLLRANEDVNSAVRNELSPPIVGANLIRILPYSQHLRTVCLRFELHGCLYDEGAPIAYSTSDGVVEPRWGHLIDYTYDGLRQRGQLSGGLGQLVDGVKGADNFSHNLGFEWVGWKSMNGDVVIEFTFKTLRNFTGALFHSNNLFSSGVEVFQAVDVHYGIDVQQSIDPLRDSLVEQQRRAQRLAAGGAASRLAGEQLNVNNQQEQGNTLWSQEVLSIEYEPDKKVENSRPVTVHLKQRLANKLRFVLKFASKWILISEVEFLSHPVELMSLSTISDQHTPLLVAALSPAKSYDECIAILREHQLRRIATNAFLESFAGQAGSGEPSEQAEQSGQPAADPLMQQQQDAAAKRTVSGPAIPQSSGSPATGLWSGYAANSDFAAPSTNPALSQQVPPAFAPPLYPPPEFGSRRDQAAPTLGAGNQAPAAESRRGSSVAGVIAFALLTLLLVLGLLFALSSYRLRQQPKLAAPSPPSKGLVGPASYLHAPDDHYHALFAPSPQAGESAAMAAHTLRRLASLAQSANKNSLLKQQQQNQLLVSVKDSGSDLFGGAKSQAVSTQLIVGLNQTNPMAKQQIYNTNNCAINQQNNYATHYSTSMSMASSSTTGNQADYADYAIPDAQPIIPPRLGQQQQQHLNHAFAANPQLGYHAQARASHRANPMQFGQHNNNPNPHLYQQQQQQQQQRALHEHNYELVYQDKPTGGSHTRTFSGGQLTSCQPSAFSSMTLSQLSGRFPNNRHQAGLAGEESSPGGSSAATTTTSANSSQDSANQHNYYYATSNATNNALEQST